MFESGNAVVLIIFVFAIYMILTKVFHIDVLGMLP